MPGSTIDLTTDETFEGAAFETRPVLRFFSVHIWDGDVCNMLWHGYTFDEAYEAAVEFHLSLPNDEREPHFWFSMDPAKVEE